MKATKRFNWKGRIIEVGEEAPEGAPKHCVEGKPAKSVDKVSAKVSTKRKKKPAQNKNAAPKAEDKAK